MKYLLTLFLVILVGCDNKPSQAEIKALCKKYNWYLYHINSLSYLDIHDDSQIEEDYINNGPDIDLGEEYKFDMDDDDDD